MVIFTQYIYNVFSKYEKERKFKLKKGGRLRSGSRQEFEVVGKSQRPKSLIHFRALSTSLIMALRASAGFPARTAS